MKQYQKEIDVLDFKVSSIDDNFPNLEVSKFSVNLYLTEGLTQAFLGP